ncbi:hypothetical protein ACFSQT_14235 [Mesorhizobium calcicola]|uniref:Uncharacterized protein n=1 Tax=Mesorhizobium calcicola TaxID=1300310 RepID=A0ABW4WED3_9HYPH
MTKSTRTLLHWALVVENGNGPYLAGQESNGRKRTSTPLVGYDPAAGTAVTASGRPYRLAGEADTEYGLAVAREVWSQIFDLTGSDIRTLTVDEAVAMIAANGNELYHRTPEEAALARQYGLAPEDIGTEIPWSEFIDELVIPDPVGDELVLLVKADAVTSIAALIHERCLTIDEAAELVDLEAAVLRGLVEHGRTDGVSIERLDKVYEALEAAPGNKREP